MSKSLTDESVGVDLPELEKKVTEGILDSKSKKEVSGSQRSLFKRDKT
jgi:hypothetical protein